MGDTQIKLPVREATPNPTPPTLAEKIEAIEPPSHFTLDRGIDFSLALSQAASLARSHQSELEERVRKAEAEADAARFILGIKDGSWHVKVPYGATSQGVYSAARAARDAGREGR